MDKSYLIDDVSNPTEFIDNNNAKDGEWAALEAVVAPKLRGEFMYMGMANVHGDCIYLYKHRDTREYLNVDLNGRFYKYNPGEETGYQKILPEQVKTLLLPLFFSK